MPLQNHLWEVEVSCKNGQGNIDTASEDDIKGIIEDMKIACSDVKAIYEELGQIQTPEPDWACDEELTHAYHSQVTLF